MRLILSFMIAVLAMCSASAAPFKTPAGWIVIETKLSFAELVARTEAAVKANQMNIVNFASATDGAKAQGFTIAGNRVLGVYRNDFARRMLAASVAAGIEAPIRVYLTEGPDKLATLSYRAPSTMFAPYFDDGGEPLKTMAGELDVIFAKIAADATKP
ncbi:DUF302 domain-containing protein [Candidatus Raskinella chloraquaticus]|uniref:Uncharacterized protein n=2 Tax=Candidatus Raskinella chloraquaticus TaxID=1951219 RepID=A0A1W9HQI0_9HYPH|nr:MAG: hypothetical protein A4S15_01880 [Proteobacteria bacterium SG_bin8]